MENKLTKKDLKFILESLNYTKLEFENYDKYPSQEFKQDRLSEVTSIINKVKSLLN